MDNVITSIVRWIRQTTQLLFSDDTNINQSNYTTLGNMVPNFSNQLVHSSDISGKPVSVDLSTIGSPTASVPNTTLISSNLELNEASVPINSNQYEYSIPHVSSIGTTLSTYASRTALISNKQSTEMQKNTQYFTYNGQHRKFYMMARYLRSAQRERRYKRRLKKRQEEQTRANLTRLANEKLYGTLNTKRVKSIGKFSVTPSPSKLQSDANYDNPTTWDEITSMESETVSLEDNGQIPLLCWRDIDLDLEVRSIDDPAEILRLSRSGFENSKDSALTTLPDAYEPVFTVDKSANYLEPTKTKTFKSRSAKHRKHSNFKKKSNPCLNVPLNKTSEADLNALVHQCSIPKSNTICSGANFNSMLQNSTPNYYMNKYQTTLPMPSNDHYSKFYNQHRPSTFLTNSLSLQPDVMRNLMNPISSNLTNPINLDKPGLLGKSRLSLASSRGDLDSEIIFQLSYYSQNGSHRSEEDLSVFSYRDGFSAEEDVSKVTVPISLSLLIMTAYILIGTFVFSSWEDPDYLKWSYFCFITLSTIGFGDIVPGWFMIYLNFGLFIKIFII